MGRFRSAHRSWLAAALALGIALSGCRRGGSSSSGTEKKRFTIATVVKVDGIAWFQQMREGVKRFADETGHEAFLEGPSQADAAQQVAIIEGLIAQRVDAICVVPFSVEALEPVLAKARAKGIIVVSHEASSQVNADVILEAFNNAAYGRHLMDHLARFMGNRGEYATFVGSLTSLSHNQWVDAALAHQKKEYPAMVNVAHKVEDYEDQTRSYTKTKELLTAHPNLGGILGSAMATAAGAALAVEEKGLQNRVQVVGTSLPSVTGPYLRSGAAKLISYWDPALAGYAMNKLAVMLLEKKKITAGTDLGVEGYRGLRVSPTRPNLFFGSAWIDVTKDTMPGEK
jgi:simple sugar transport system substrate-binding protein